jgi:hypothetical protein
MQLVVLGGLTMAFIGCVLPFWTTTLAIVFGLLLGVLSIGFPAHAMLYVCCKFIVKIATWVELQYLRVKWRYYSWLFGVPCDLAKYVPEITHHEVFSMDEIYDDSSVAEMVTFVVTHYRILNHPYCVLTEGEITECDVDSLVLRDRDSIAAMLMPLREITRATLIISPECQIHVTDKLKKLFGPLGDFHSELTGFDASHRILPYLLFPSAPLRHPELLSIPPTESLITLSINWRELYIGAERTEYNTKLDFYIDVDSAALHILDAMNSDEIQAPKNLACDL